VDLEGTTLEEKYSDHSFRGANMSEATQITQLGVALRNARVNHACKPNAPSIYDETALVAILFAQKNFHPGEEITICYYSPFFGFSPYLPSVSLLLPAMQQHRRG